MCVFVVLDLVWLGEQVRNDLYCVELGIKPQLNQSFNSKNAKQMGVGFKYMVKTVLMTIT